MAWGTVDYFVDSSATGTGDGSSPANAAINITSMWSTVTSANLGANVWVRRTHVQFAPDTRSMAWGALTTSSLNVNSHAVNWTIGWPNSGDPFYEERPSSAISAGWDADAAAHMFWPSIVVSGNVTAGLQLRRNSAVTNFTMVKSSTAAATGILSDIFGSDSSTFIGWLGLMYTVGAATGRQVDHAIICLTPASSADRLAYIDSFRRVTITASCMHGSHIVNGFGALYRGTQGGIRIEEIACLSSSISCLFELGDTNAHYSSSIGRVRGTRPYSADAIPTSNAQYGSIAIDDYFGNPAILVGRSSGISEWRVSSAGVAAYSGSAAFRTRCESVAIAANLGNINGIFPEASAPIRQNISVTSGVPVTLRLPLAMANVGSFEFYRGVARFIMPADGCGERFCSLTNSGIQPGSTSLWTGSLTGVQSYYQMYARFVPAETAVVPVSVRLPAHGNVGSGAAMYYPPFIEVGSA